MFDYEKTLRKLGKIEKYPEAKQRKVIKKLLSNDDMMEWMFDSGRKNTNNSDDLPITAAMVDKIFTSLSRPKVLNVILSILEDEEIDLTRSQCTFIYSVCNYGVDQNAKRSKELTDAIKSNSIITSEAKSTKRRIEKYSNLISDVIRCLRKAIKPWAKPLAKRTNIPRDICTHVFWHIPDIKYVPASKVGYYMNTLLSMIYSDVAVSGFADTSRIDWRPFFKEAFGKENLPSAATFILLEGVNRIDAYKDSDAIDSIRNCWDSLTEFALKELDGTSEETRSQMIELYIKRIDRMFKNNTYDLRVNILQLPKQFKSLISTVSKYTDKINSIINK